ncbi:MAG TPA: glycosyltransferase family 4 protein [Anaerolineales bacterium]|nr:glycosyltransferase family 4 protein [Anaerolineales bacterium]
MTPLLIFTLVAILSYLIVSVIRRYAEKYQILDHPSKRSSHIVPTPRGGGLAIVALVLAIGICFGIQAGLNQRLIYLVCGAVIAWLGWRDDLHSLSPRVRFIVQGIVAAISIWWLGYFKVVTIPMFGELRLGVIGIVITFLWIIGLTNAYNFMDGINGMAGGVALSAGIGWMWLASNINNPFVFWIALAITAGSLGFLGHNWSPARIFMGDVGSTFLGYSFAVLPLISSDQGGDALLLGTLLMWTIIMDAGVTFIGRLFKRENVFAPHRSHLYQRLVIAGYKHETVSALYIVLTLLAGQLSFEWSQGHRFAAPLIFLGLPLIWVILSIYAARLRNIAPETKPLVSDS